MCSFIAWIIYIFGEELIDESLTQILKKIILYIKSADALNFKDFNESDN